MSSKKKRNKECAYCGRIGQVTDDHIPPESLFVGVPNDKLIHVPACERCNHEASLDDEYFKIILTLREDVNNHPTVQSLLPSVRAALANPKKAGLRKKVVGTFQKVYPRTPSGLILPPKYIYGIDIPRLVKVVRRVTKGLFYTYEGFRLPSDFTVTVTVPWAMRVLTAEELEYLKESLFDPFSNSPGIIVGNNDFLFKSIFFKDQPNVSGWLYLFYEKITFIAMTGPPA